MRVPKLSGALPEVEVHRHLGRPLENPDHLGDPAQPAGFAGDTARKLRMARRVSSRPRWAWSRDFTRSSSRPAVSRRTRSVAASIIIWMFVSVYPTMSWISRVIRRRSSSSVSRCTRVASSWKSRFASESARTVRSIRASSSSW